MQDHEQARRDALEELMGSGADELDALLQAGKQLPAEWLSWTPDRAFEFLRCRLAFTQDELSLKSGLAQSQISRVEGGRDARLSTWSKLYSTMGFTLVLVPVSALSSKQLQLAAESGRPPGHYMKQRARPRRRWIRQKDGTVRERKPAAGPSPEQDGRGRC